MKQSELIKTISKKTHINEDAVKDVVQVFKKMIYDTLKNEETVIIEGLGKFYSKEYQGRTIVTPQGIKVNKKSCRSPRFKPSKNLKDYINR